MQTKRRRLVLTGILVVLVLAIGIGVILGIRKNRSSRDLVKKTPQVLMIYMVASDLESDSGLATKDIEEMLESDVSEEDMTILLCAGGTLHWETEEFEDDPCAVYEIYDGKIEKKYSMENKNMGEDKTLQEFLDYSYNHYGADSYNLIMWDHGGGAVLGFGADENYNNDMLTMSEMDRAFAQSRFYEEGIRFNWIGFDACLMGMLEVADMLSPYAQYLIASEDIEAEDGWDYGFLEIISDEEYADGEKAAVEIMNAYETYSVEEYQYDVTYSISCVNLDKIDAVVEAFDELVDVAHEDIQGDKYGLLVRNRHRTRAFGTRGTSIQYDTIDLYDFSVQMAELYPTEAGELQKRIENAVIYNKTNILDAYGIAVYFPYQNTGHHDDWMGKYTEYTFSSNYFDFLESFWSMFCATEEEVSKDIDAVQSIDPYTQEITLQLTEVQASDIVAAKYTIWGQVESDPEFYQCWYVSEDVTIDENGTCRAFFSGKRFVLEDSIGQTMVCMAIETERNDTYTEYYLSLLREPKGLGFLYTQKLDTYIRVDENHPKGTITGIYDAEETDIPDRRQLVINKGDVICSLPLTRKLTYDENNQLETYDKWEDDVLYMNEMDVFGKIRVTVEDVPMNTTYLCFFQLYDSHGNITYTKPIFVTY